ncbi:MAG: PhoH family protein [Deferribacterota bacterium]|nr:PhoH family protein [Deferribacterota bacterium]
MRKKITLDEQVIPWILGQEDSFVKYIKSKINVNISARSSNIYLEGDENEVLFVEKLLKHLSAIASKRRISIDDVKDVFNMLQNSKGSNVEDVFLDRIRVAGWTKEVFLKTKNQYNYVNAIRNNDVVFCIGPAGTGKTYLAMALAINMFLEKKISRIILTRPAVEAGESLGFLPGDIAAKIDPYLRPLYDALFEMLDAEKANRLIEKGVIELAPLAYMRGRTLNDSFIVLDEAQNTTIRQLKMFLTRLGFNSKAVINGDVTQVDLPANKNSGLILAQDILRDIKDIKFIYFDKSDVVRNPIVQRIIEAFDEYEREATS